ncbi:helix-hairpin-helix domain-containing protein [Robertmurraya andreesenii]|uniref:Competence protein ComEA n=1 Tax=Anoxybacillus andreesenii TaxID=1325932 RepID=A0ABT9V5B8_9BACL|nr:helix-hairpin-helix domain-containing protein [Robertmurraya andreesenii]MDQ0156030.1 competence protein ComEA [Robertmurraya andreesenii]
MLQWLKERIKFVGAGLLVVILVVYYFISNDVSFSPPEDAEGWEMEEIDGEEEVPPEQLPVEEILVDVKGAVQKPGVYKAKMGERVIDLIDRAGGVTEAADSKAINFAMRVTDEMVLYVPHIGEEVENVDMTASASGESNSGKINLNKASQSELETLPGIGPVKAQAIIEYRDSSGPFKAIEDIMEISGFGQKTFEKLKEHISVN